MAKAIFSKALLVAMMGGALALTAPVVAQGSPVSITSEIKVERTVADASGNSKTVLTDPAKVVITPGEKLLITVNVANNGSAPVSGLKANNPMPEAVSFVAANEEWAEVSVDGGNTFGKLGSLKVAAAPAEGVAPTMRPALPEDVTNVRWSFNDAIAPGTKRSVSFRGIVK